MTATLSPDAPTEPSKALDEARRILAEMVHWKVGDFYDGTGAAKLADALDRFRAAGVREERARQQAIIHSLCPDAKNNWCRGGMLYDVEGKAMGACEWPGHVAGGNT